MRSAAHAVRPERMNLEFFIARRLAAGGSRRALTVRVAECSVALSLAVMILALAVIMGFKREITRRLAGFAGHVRITDVRGLGGPSSDPVRCTPELDALVRACDGVAAVHPYAVREGIVRTDDAVQGVLLKGVGPDYDWSFFEEFLVAGHLPRTADSVRTKEVLFSRRAASELLLAPGDRAEMLFADPEGGLRRDRFRVAGIYDTGMEEMDRTLVVGDLRDVRRLPGWGPGEASGCEVTAAGVAEAGAVAARIEDALFRSELEETANLAAVSIGEEYAHIFDWLRAHDVNAAVVIAVMLAVAFFNMAAALLVLVFERMRMIGVLRTMGMTGRAVQRLFLWRSSFILLRGAVWGNLAGVALCLAQRHFHLLKLSSEGYMLSEVPVALEWGWLLALDGGAAAAIVLLMTLPARVAAAVKPSETIHYE